MSEGPNRFERVEALRQKSDKIQKLLESVVAPYAQADMIAIINDYAELWFAHGKLVIYEEMCAQMGKMTDMSRELLEDVKKVNQKINDHLVQK
jgi:hypothetical protein